MALHSFGRRFWQQPSETSMSKRQNNYIIVRATSIPASYPRSVARIIFEKKSTLMCHYDTNISVEKHICLMPLHGVQPFHMLTGYSK